MTEFDLFVMNGNFYMLIFICRIVSSLSSLKVPEDVNLFPGKMYHWFPDPDEKLSIVQALDYTVEQGGIEW